MKCPHCGKTEDKVIESRTLADGTSIRRRRECLDCGFRFTSYERIEERSLMVIKSNGRRQPFERLKLARGLQRAVEKRPVSQDVLEEILNEIEDEAGMLSKGTDEVSSSALGEMMLSKLYRLDKVAYIRFASVYRNFAGVEEFIKAIRLLESGNKEG